MITELKDNQLIVVGTNAGGIHAGGAAAQAFEDFGALLGCAQGCIGGQSYGIVTLDYEMQEVSLEFIERQVGDLKIVAMANPLKEFLVTKVGCGIAGFKEEEIAPLFKNMPENVILPEDWK